MCSKNTLLWNVDLYKIAKLNRYYLMHNFATTTQ